MIEQATLNGISLSGWVTIESGSGFSRAPQIRTKGLELAGLHGELQASLVVYSANQIVLPLLVKGQDRTTGVMVDDGVAQLKDNLDFLTRELHQPTIMLDHYYPDGRVLRATGRMKGDPFAGERLMSAPPTVRVSVAIGIPGAFWADVVPVSTPVYTLSSGATQSLDAFALATAPCDELLVTFYGPVNNPRLQQGNALLGYDGTITAGQQLVIDASNWTLSRGAGSAWTPSYPSLRYLPTARWFELQADYPAPAVTFTHTTGSPASFSVSGRRKYLLG